MKVRNLLRSLLSSFVYDSFSFLELHLHHTISLLKGLQLLFHSKFRCTYKAPLPIRARSFIRNEGQTQFKYFFHLTNVFEGQNLDKTPHSIAENTLETWWLILTILYLTSTLTSFKSWSQIQFKYSFIPLCSRRF